jgi:2-keto-4-pentenoate hydratase
MKAHELAAEQLFEASRTRKPGPLLSVTFPKFTIEDAYQIQLSNVRRRVAGGATVRGFKVGLTNRTTQLQVGVEEPDYGHLYDDMFVSDGGAVRTSSFCLPGAEPEIAFVFHSPLRGPNVNVADVLRATAFVLPSLELVDSHVLRNTGHRFTIVDTVADNGGAAGIVLGARPVAVTDYDLSEIGVLLRRNGQIVGTGSTGAVLGHPANAIAWLVNKLGEFGVSIEPGQVVLSGSCTQILRTVGKRRRYFS